MSDFPQRNASFNPNAYRSLAAYNAHKNASAGTINAPKPTSSFNPPANRNNAAHTAHKMTSGGNTNAPKPTSSFKSAAYRTQAASTAHKKASTSNIDALKPSSSFNRNAYRGQVSYNTHNSTSTGNVDSPKCTGSFNATAYCSQVAHTPTAHKNASRGGVDTPKRHQYGKHQKKWGSQAFSSKAKNTDEPHYMSDAEVKEWFRQAEVDYERKKKAGHYDNYVPAGGHTPNFSDFRRKFAASETKCPGMKNSMHAPKALEPIKSQDRK